MKYTLLAVVLIVAVLAFVIFLGLAFRQRLAAQRELRRQRARQRATWQDTVSSKDGRTQVLVQKIARDGSWSEVLDQVFVGQVNEDREDYEVQLDELWTKAKNRVYQLNTGPLM